MEDEPTQEEIDEHNLGHSTFRSWCPHCVKGEATCYPLIRRKDKDPREILRISIGNAYMEEDKERENEREKGMPILVVKDSATGMKVSRAVPKKGVNPYTLKDG